MAQPLNAMELMGAWNAQQARIQAMQHDQMMAEALLPHRIEQLQANALRDREAISQGRNALAFQREQAMQGNVLARDKMAQTERMAQNALVARAQMQKDALAAKSAAAAAKGPQLTKGEEAADKEFAKEYTAFKASGGYADTVKQLGQLAEASRALKGDKGLFGLTGSFVGNFPDQVRAVTNPKAVATKEAVQEVAQRNLRLVLGAQFTEKEGERLIARVYNDRLPPAENAKRVDRLMTQIQRAAQAKQDASNYFETHGTLKGWKGKTFTMSDFDPDAGMGGGGAPQAGAVEDGWRFKGGNPSDRINWEKL